LKSTETGCSSGRARARCMISAISAR